MPISELFRRPLPELPSDSTALDYHSIPIDLEHAYSSERLVDVHSAGLAAESFYSRKDGLNAPYFCQIRSSLYRVWSRESLVRRLVSINERLSSLGLELFLLDGYRPVDCQQALWDHFIAIAKRTLPNPTEENCTRFVGQYWSNPSGFSVDDFTTWPTHATGGAIDLTLRRIGGELLYMGGIFDDTSELSHLRYYEALNGLESASYEEARRNRRLLYWLMIEEGFANYSYEWWHFDLGNQMWVMNRAMLPGARPEHAYYGLARETEEVKKDRVG